MSSRKLASALLLVFLAAGAIGAATNAGRAVGATVRLVEGAAEPADPSVLGVGRGSAAPDYRLDLRVGGDWIDCGTFPDTPVGEGLHFRIPGRVALDDVEELRLVEVDRVSDDVLERVSVGGRTAVGEAYRFEIETELDWWIGVDWLLSTPVGILVGVGIVVAVAVLVIGTLSFEV